MRPRDTTPPISDQKAPLARRLPMAEDSILSQKGFRAAGQNLYKW